MIQIESPKNEQVIKWKKLHTKKGRAQTGCFLVEGIHLVEEALRSSWIVETILTTNVAPFPGEKTRVVHVSERVMKELSETKSPQGVIAICRKKEMTPQSKLTGIYVLCDRIQDPGNVGTIIRTALAAGASGVVLGAGSVDLFHAKVIRATQGAFFHLPVYHGVLTEWIESFQTQRVPIYGTSLHDAVSYKQVSPISDVALLLGNEGEGVDASLLKQVDKKVYIPQHPKAESLNVAVACGIFLYHFMKDMPVK
ncbi:TrmH family RNA methyltransferase [Shouchella lonarensis]|uniref:RNA methyltransferase, TrmH family n=1 Tax=Shouchella lonarensis TaxID=1464122 RepID=A0A1G6K5C6_9BACI|nr:RNA methyltransferase [Shouchella lonarensis]SDC25805.1 RNA methyltransferase, TrmH family [Shouchella lonarensis]